MKKNSREELNMFFLFLKEHKAYENYMKNIDLGRMKIYGDIKSDESPFIYCPFTQLINAAFSWSTTEQTRDYWVNLHKMWQKKVTTWISAK